MGTDAFVDADTSPATGLAVPTRSGLLARLPTEIVEVDSDRFAMETWLRSYSQRSPHTARSFRKEAERFLLWLDAMKGPNTRHLPAVGIEEVNAYIDFLVAPRRFTQELLAQHGRTTQPFKGPLERSSMRQAIVILHRMFEALRNVRGPNGLAFIQFNPWVLARGLVVEDNADEVEEALTEEEWQAVLSVIDELPQRTHRELAHYHRTRWIFQLLYRAFLRREEAVDLRMAHFVNRSDGWALKVAGKGRKTRSIVATSRLMAELEVYRRSLGLPALPSAGENRPVILPIIGKEQPVSSQTVYLVCCSVFRDASLLMTEQGKDGPASRLMQATPHWLRHTGISHSLDQGTDPRYVQAQARHSSLKVTARYDHKNKRLWREQLERCI